MTPAASTTAAGTVKWFNVLKGYGYITLEDGSADIFVHKTNIAKNNPRKAVPSLGDGEMVVFNIAETAKGPEAVEVTGPRGRNVQGSVHAWERKSRPTASHGSKSGSTSYTIIDVAIQTAMALAGGDHSRLQVILPAILRKNQLPVCHVPDLHELSPPQHQSRKKANPTAAPKQPPRHQDIHAAAPRLRPRPLLILPRPLNRRNCQPHPEDRQEERDTPVPETTPEPDDPTPPLEDATPPADDPTPPSEDPTPAPEDTTPPAEDTAPPSEDPTPAPEDTTPPAENTTVTLTRSKYLKLFSLNVGEGTQYRYQPNRNKIKSTVTCVNPTGSVFSAKYDYNLGR